MKDPCLPQWAKTSNASSRSAGNLVSHDTSWLLKQVGSSSNFPPGAGHCPYTSSSFCPDCVQSCKRCLVFIRGLERRSYVQAI